MTAGLDINQLTKDRPQVVVSFPRVDDNEVLECKNSGMDIAELRVDLLEDNSFMHVKKQLNKLADVPVLLTIRTRNEGGKWSKTEKERLELFSKLAPLVDMVDIELSSRIKPEVITVFKELKKLVQVSQHDFIKTPSLQNLSQLAQNAFSSGADIFKIATFVDSKDDLQTLINFMDKNYHQNLVVIGMGDLGRSSRIFFPALGSLLTYTYVGEPTAGGQFGFADTVNLVNKFYK